MIAFVVPGVPVAKARARVSMRGGFARAYTPRKTADYERAVAQSARLAMRGLALLEGPLELFVVAYMPIPASWGLKKKRLAASGELPHVSRPDLDNLVKSVKDGMNGVAYRDDAQIVALSASKRYSDEPRVEVSVAQKK